MAETFFAERKLGRRPLEAFLCATALSGLAVALFIFIGRFAPAFPVTDEWHFLSAAMQWDASANWRQAFQAVPHDHNGHPSFVSFLVYLAIMKVASFDSRALIALSVACFTVQALVFRKFVPNPVAWLPVAAVFFTPARYYDFLWSFMFTLALAGAFVLAALWLIESYARTNFVPTIIGALLLLTLGTLSAGNGIFGFPAAVFLIAIQPMKRLHKVLAISLMSLLAISLYKTQIPNLTPKDISLNAALGMLYGLGATIWTAPVVQLKFGFDQWSLTGLAILIFGAVAFVRILLLPNYLEFGLPAAIFIYSILATASVLVARGGWANWHTQLAVPAVAAIYATSAGLPRIALGSLLLCSSFAFVDGMTNRGPWYSSYTESIRTYMKGDTLTPPQPVFIFTPEMRSYLLENNPTILDK